MRRRHAVRVLMVMGVAVLATAGGFATAALPASAAGTGAACAHFVGPFPQGPFMLSGCSDVAGTGGSGSLDNHSGVITWSTGKTTSVSFELKPMQERQGCPPTSAAEFKVHGKVTADTTGTIAGGGRVSGELCGRESETLFNVPGTKFVMR
jgi:hypothetical protein